MERVERLGAQRGRDAALLPRAERLAVVLRSAGERLAERVGMLEAELLEDRAAGEEMAAELRTCAAEEAEIQARLRGAGEVVTGAEVAAQRLRDQAGEAEMELKGILEALGLAFADDEQSGALDDEQSGALDDEQEQALLARLQRLQRRREQLGPVNPLAQEEYAEAVAHVEEMEGRREDLETALRELRAVIRDTDRQIQARFEETFLAAGRNFEELVGEVFPGGSGRLRLVSDEQSPRPILGGQALSDNGPFRSRGPAVVGGAVEEAGEGDDAAAEAAAEEEANRSEIGGPRERGEEELLGVEIEIAPAGKATKRLSLLSGGEKSMTALAFLFAVFLARPCPFYILDEVEAALDDLNLDRFLALLRRFSDRAQFIVITHQKRTMEAADWLYGVSMGGDGVSKVLSRRLPAEGAPAPEVAEVA
jgi:chromosome segregation protein